MYEAHAWTGAEVFEAANHTAPGGRENRSDTDESAMIRGTRHRLSPVWAGGDAPGFVKNAPAQRLCRSTVIALGHWCTLHRRMSLLTAPQNAGADASDDAAELNALARLAGHWDLGAPRRLRHASTRLAALGMQ